MSIISNREILFRAKGLTTNRWYTGYYFQQDEVTYCFKQDYDKHPDNTKHYITFDKHGDWGLANEHLMVMVDPNTVCQYIGEDDKTGKRIFEGDILRLEHFKNPICEVRFSKCAFTLFFPGCPTHVDIRNIYQYNKVAATIIGNIYDQPELLHQ